MCASTRERPNSRTGSFRRRIYLGLSASATLALAACGGGGGGSPSAAANPPANSAPSVQAGADQTVALPTNSVQLQGSATDDGPVASLSYAWSVTSGSGVTFSSANAAATSATFPAAGTYVLTLTVSDGSLSGSDSVQVTVSPAQGSNTAPTVSAGADQTIVLPATTAQLQGTASDDNLPGNILTYQWSSTASGVTIAAATALATGVTLPATPGAYELTLTVSDGALSASDSVVVTVANAMSQVYPAPDPADDSDPLHGWAQTTPAEAGMDAARLDAARTYAESGHGAGGSGLISRGGRLVYSWGNIDQKFEMKSTTKSIGGTILGLALHSDHLLTIDQRARTVLPTLGDDPPGNDPARLDQITVLQLATHTAGFAKAANNGVLQFDPGTTWLYSDAGLNWLADVLTQVYNRDLRDLLFERITLPLGLAGLRPGTTPSADDITWAVAGNREPLLNGVQRRELHSSMSANTNTMARIGLLFLRRGMWANGIRLLAEDFINLAQTPRPEIAALANPLAADFPGATTDYAVLWWTNTSGQLANVPRDAYWAWGLGESLIVVIPSLDLVIARAGPQATTDEPGRVWNDANWNGNYSVLAPLLDPIVQSITP